MVAHDAILSKNVITVEKDRAPSEARDWPNWGRPPVSGAVVVAPFETAVELTATLAEIVEIAEAPEGFGDELRRLLTAYELRLEATRPDALAYLRARRAWSLSPLAWWFLAAAIGWEIVPRSARAPTPTIGSCARIATALAGDSARLLGGMAIAAPGGELARLDLITVVGDGAFYGRGVRVTPRILELALADELGGPHLDLVRAGQHLAEPIDQELLDRIGAALVDRTPHRLGDAGSRDHVIPAILHVAETLGIPVMIARASDPPAVVVREALLAEAAIVLAGASLAHPAWALHRHALLIVS
ncbi:MAG: hypothetical protein NT062_12505 [Proteobacteria bacterium]|nr:hypothetical protein [Pseudomonadota bacterium]